VLDVSNPFSPTETGFYAGSWFALDVVVDGNYAYVSDREGGLFILRVNESLASVPGAPPEPTEPSDDFHVGLVTDVGGINDESSNSACWKGMEKAAVELGVGVAYLGSQGGADYAPNTTPFLD
jgi:hypothetical protein